MHPLHDDVARILAEKVRLRGVVVWYDPRLEFAAFVRELRNGMDDQSAHVVLAGGHARAARVPRLDVRAACRHGAAS